MTLGGILFGAPGLAFFALVGAAIAVLVSFVGLRIALVQGVAAGSLGAGQQNP